MSDDFLDVDRALERSIVRGENRYTGYDAMLDAYEPRPETPEPVDPQYVRTVDEDAREKAQRERMLVVLKAGTPEQKAEVLSQLRKGEPPRGQAFLAIRACQLAGAVTLPMNSVVEISDQAIGSNRHLSALEDSQDTYPADESGQNIFLLVQGKNRG